MNSINGEIYNAYITFRMISKFWTTPLNWELWTSPESEICVHPPMETRANANFHIQSYLIIVNSPLQPFEFDNYGRPSAPLLR